MALSITPFCVNCHACLDLCPNGAVIPARPHFRIDAAQCTECVGQFADAQCASICPVEAALLDASGDPVNPPGSLTGIPPGRLPALGATISPEKGAHP